MKTNLYVQKNATIRQCLHKQEGSNMAVIEKQERHEQMSRAMQCTTAEKAYLSSGGNG